MKGKFIVFEGGEFCGKTTMANMLYDNLKNSGYDVILTREPGGTKAGEDIRKILKSHNLKAFTKLYLNLAAREEHLYNVIIPALNDGKIVICDRYFLSTYVYQSIEGIPKEIIAKYKPEITPDLTIVLDIDPKISIKRSKSRAVLDDNDLKDISFHEKVRDEYLSINHPKVQFVDANNPVSKVFDDVLGLACNYNIIDAFNNHIRTINCAILKEAMLGNYKYEALIKNYNSKLMNRIAEIYKSLGFTIGININIISISWYSPKPSDGVFSAMDVKLFTDNH